MSSVYKKQLCGVCGNFDGQVTRELEGPQRQVYQDAFTFFNQYQYSNLDPSTPAGQCTTPPHMVNSHQMFNQRPSQMFPQYQ